MKKMILPVLCLALLASGCSFLPAEETHSQPTQTQETTASPATATTETVPAVPYQNPLTAVSLIPYADAVRSGDGTELYRISSQQLSLVMGDHAVAEVITDDFAARGDALAAAAKNALASAAEDYTGQADWTAYFCDITYDTKRLDQMVLSLMGVETFYDGTQRSGQNVLSFTYDMHTGSFLALKDILVPDFSADDLVQKILDALADRADSLYEDYAESISSLFTTNVPVDNWYFTGNGLCFYFNPYEIAPQSMGTVLAEIPYSSLPGLLKDGCFPAEAVEFSGSISMTAFNAEHAASITQFAEAILDEEGERYLITPRGTVLNVRIETGTWNKNGTFAASATVFAAEALTDGNALLLQLPKEDLGSLCITYQTGPEIQKTPWQAE